MRGRTKKGTKWETDDNPNKRINGQNELNESTATRDRGPGTKSSIAFGGRSPKKRGFLCLRGSGSLSSGKSLTIALDCHSDRANREKRNILNFPFHLLQYVPALVYLYCVVFNDTVAFNQGYKVSI